MHRVGDRRSHTELNVESATRPLPDDLIVLIFASTVATIVSTSHSADIASRYDDYSLVREQTRVETEGSEGGHTVRPKL